MVATVLTVVGPLGVDTIEQVLEAAKADREVILTADQQHQGQVVGTGADGQEKEEVIALVAQHGSLLPTTTRTGADGRDRVDPLVDPLSSLSAAVPRSSIRLHRAKQPKDAAPPMGRGAGGGDGSGGAGASWDRAKVAAERARRRAAGVGNVEVGVGGSVDNHEPELTAE